MLLLLLLVAVVVLLLAGGGAAAAAAVVVVGGGVAATDHRRQCSCANQARGANSRGSQQAPFAKHKRLSDRLSHIARALSLEPLWSAGSQFPGLAAYVTPDSNEVGGRVFTCPRGEKSLSDLGLGFRN